MELYKDIDFEELEKKIKSIVKLKDIHMFDLLDHKDLAKENEDGIRIAVSRLLQKGEIVFKNELLSSISKFSHLI
jgi:hypothetical protein